MFKLVALAVLVVVATLAPASSYSYIYGEWENFKAVYEKNYVAREELYRFKIFRDNMDFVREHNLAHDRGEKTYRCGINEHSDKTSGEFVGGCLLAKSRLGTSLFKDNNTKLPDTVDWRTKGYVTPVKNQGTCGACWTFSATGAIEGQHFKRTGRLVSLSEQSLVDCAITNGCAGGTPDEAFDYIMKRGGIDTEESYTYKAEVGTCRFQEADVGATVTGHVDIPVGDEDALQRAVATIGPISAGIDTNAGSSFQHYQSGLYHNPDCSSTQLNHAVLVVGYGTSNGDDYWLVKNSYGESWGMRGYIRMSRNKNNNCGIATLVSYPLVGDRLGSAGPASIQVKKNKENIKVQVQVQVQT